MSELKQQKPKNLKPKVAKKQVSKKDLVVEDIISKVRSMNDAELKKVSFFTDSIKKDNWNTFVYKADGMMGKLMYYKIVAFNSIQSSAKNAIGVRIGEKEFVELWSKMSKVMESMEDVINFAYERDIGDKWQIEKYNKEKKKAEETTSSGADTTKPVEKK